MKHPQCGCEVETNVVDSRPAIGQNVRYRRRQCGKCGKRFDTVEIDRKLYEKLATLASLAGSVSDIENRLFIIAGNITAVRNLFDQARRAGYFKVNAHAKNRGSTQQTERE